MYSSAKKLMRCLANLVCFTWPKATAKWVKKQKKSDEHGKKVQRPLLRFVKSTCIIIVLSFVLNTLQVMPQLLNYLKLDSTGDSIDWATLVVYTCSKDCDLEGQYWKEFIWKQDFVSEHWQCFSSAILKIRCRLLSQLCWFYRLEWYWQHSKHSRSTDWRLRLFAIHLHKQSEFVYDVKYFACVSMDDFIFG